MDAVTSAVYEKINSLAPLGKYVVISEDEFFETFPQDTENGVTELKKALKFLTSAGYIDLKYSSGSMYCVAPLKKFYNKNEQLPTVLQEKKAVFKIKPEFWFAFVGGAAGSLIVSIIFAVINYAG